MKPLVSVIIPNFNHASYVTAAIQSVLNQNYRYFEIIVVDDGSTDNSREVIADFGDQVNYIWQENQGLSAARNTGIQKAKGVVIGLLDADDIYEPDYLSTLVKILDDNPDLAGVYCGYQFVDHQDNPLPQVEARVIPDDQLYQALLDGNFLVPESMLVRKQIYQEVGPFDVNLRACEDWDMWLRISKKYRIMSSDKVLTRHRILPGSMSANPDRMLTNRLAVLRKHVGPQETGHGVYTLRRAYGRAYLSSCIEYFQYGDPMKAFACFQEMARVCPELLNELDTFYQLGCGDQPKGSMGHFSTVNIKNNEQILIDFLDQLFGNRYQNSPLNQYTKSAYANAYFALGLLSYGARQMEDARRYLLLALQADRHFLLNSQLMATFLKSLIGAKYLTRGRISTTN